MTLFWAIVFVTLVLIILMIFNTMMLAPKKEATLHVIPASSKADSPLALSEHGNQVNWQPLRHHLMAQRHVKRWLVMDGSGHIVQEQWPTSYQEQKNVILQMDFDQNK